MRGDIKQGDNERERAFLKNADEGKMRHINGGKVDGKNEKFIRQTKRCAKKAQNRRKIQKQIAVKNIHRQGVVHIENAGHTHGKLPVF